MLMITPDHDPTKDDKFAPPRRLADFFEKPIVIALGLIAVSVTAGWLYLLSFIVTAVGEWLIG